MPAKHWLLIGLLFSLTATHAAEAEDPSLEAIEMLGGIGEDEVDLDIAMSDIGEKINEKIAAPQEVKDDE